MTFNPFPWARPKEDPRAGRPEPLHGAGLGTGKPPRESATPLDHVGQGLEILALTLGLGVPLSAVILVGSGLPPVVWIAATASVVAAVVVAGVRGARWRRRMRDRVAAREQRRAAARVEPSGR